MWQLENLLGICWGYHDEYPKNKLFEDLQGTKILPSVEFPFEAAAFLH